MKRTLTVVFDDISEWSNSYGTFYGIGGMFDDGSILQANKKTRADAQELRTVLLDLLDEEFDYFCDDKGQSKNGNQKWALKAILNPETGEPVYGKAPQGTQGGGAAAGVATRPVISRPPESSKDSDIRAAVALKAAVEYAAGKPEPVGRVKEIADEFESWLKSKSSAAVESSAVPPFSATPAADPSSVGVGDGEAPAPTDSTSGGVADGEAAAPPGTKRYTGSPPPGWVTDGTGGLRNNEL